MVAAASSDQTSIARLAASHGLHVDAEKIGVEEAGLDFRVAFAADQDGAEWVLRIPRRDDVAERAEDEARILAFVREHLTVEVPDWRIRSSELIAYPLLPGEPGLTIGRDGQPLWHFDREDPHYARELGLLIAGLHGIEPEAARAAGVPVETGAEVRAEWRNRVERASAEFEVSGELLDIWRDWIADDELWPEYTAFTHGELYPAHLLLDSSGAIRSVLDWTTAKVGDPVADFMYHHMLSTPETFRITVDAYAEVMGREPRRLEDRCTALASAGPLTYADFALTTGEAEHMEAAAAQLNP